MFWLKKKRFLCENNSSRTVSDDGRADGVGQVDQSLLDWSLYTANCGQTASRQEKKKGEGYTFTQGYKEPSLKFTMAQEWEKVKCDSHNISV